MTVKYKAKDKPPTTYQYDQYKTIRLHKEDAKIVEEFMANNKHHTHFISAVRQLILSGIEYENYKANLVNAQMKIG